MRPLRVFLLSTCLLLLQFSALGQGKHVSKQERIDTLIAQSRRLYYADKETEALPLIDEALSLLRKPTRKNGTVYAELMRIKSGCYYYIKETDPLQGIEVTEKALELYNKYRANDTLKIGIYDKLATFYMYANQWDEAEKNLILGREEHTRLNSRDSLQYMSLSASLTYLYCVINDVQKAGDLLNETLTLQKNLLTDDGYYDALELWYGVYCHLDGANELLIKKILEGLISVNHEIDENRETAQIEYLLALSEIDASLDLLQESLASICEAEALYSGKGKVPQWAIIQQKAWALKNLNSTEEALQLVKTLRGINEKEVLGIENDIDYLYLSILRQQHTPFTDNEFRILDRLISATGDNDKGLFYLYSMYAYEEQDPYKSIEYLKKVIEIIERSKIKHDNAYARVLKSIGDRYYNAGEYQNALSYYSLAIDVFQRADSNSAEYANLLESTAYAAHELKEYGLALSLYEIVYSFYKQIDIYNPNIIRNLLNLHSSFGNKKRFEELYTVYKDSVSPEDVITQLDIAFREMDNCIAVGDVEKAMALYKQYLSIFNSLENKEDYPYLSENFARFHSAMYSGDESLFDFYTDYFAKKSDSWDISDSWVPFSLADLQYMKEDYYSANFLYKLVTSEEDMNAEYYRKSFFSALVCDDEERCRQMVPSLLRFIRNQFKVVTGLTETEKESYWSEINSIKDILFTHRSDSSIDEELYNVVLLSKNFVQKSGIALSNLMIQSEDEELASMSLELRAIKNRLNDIHSGLDLDIQDSLRIREIELTREIGIKLKGINMDSVLGSADFQHVVNSLNDGEIAIEIVSYYDLIRYETEGKKYAAFLLSKEINKPIFVPLFCEKEINQLLDITPQKLYDPDLPFSHDLYRIVIEPIYAYIKNAKTLYISLDGILNTMAIEAIPLPTGYSFEDVFSVKRISSTADVGQYDQGEHYESAVIYGGINYSSSASDNSLVFKEQTEIGYIIDRSGGEVIKYLPATKSEAERITKLLSKNHIQSSSFMGDEGTEESFKSLSGEKVTIVHIATHGFYKPQDKIGRIAFFGSNESNRPVSSMQRSGLLLAGCNDAWEGNIPMGREDGVLTASEIENLDLSNTQLVVLSACETGLGDVTEDGIAGLQRAFKNAGVKSIIMSLWKVDDKATEILMTDFYTSLSNGLPRTVAFMNAKNNLKHQRQYENPYYWASFILLD